MLEQMPEMEKTLAAKLKQGFPDEVIAEEKLGDMLCITVKKGQINQILQFLFDEPGLQYQFLTTLCGMHYPGDEPRLGLVYHLHSLAYNHRIRIKTYTTMDDPHFPTATNIFSAANWMERETYDFFGIIFDGHPNLKRILNVDDFEGFPLRKDFMLEDQTREDKNDAMFGR